MNDIYNGGNQTNYIAHYGVKGMKWGVRKSQNSQNPNYSSNQRERDKQIYGRRGVKRINRKMNEGSSIGTARSIEKTRRDKVKSKSKYVRQTGKVAGAVAGGIAGFLGANAAINKIASKKGQQVVSKIFGVNAPLASAALTNPMVLGVAAAGGAKIADMFAGDLTVSAYERAHGYNPSRKK